MTGVEITLTAAFVILFVIILSVIGRHIDPDEYRDRRDRRDPPGWL